MNIPSLRSNIFHFAASAFTIPDTGFIAHDAGAPRSARIKSLANPGIATKQTTAKIIIDNFVVFIRFHLSV
jgi:hypothetical protein